MKIMYTPMSDLNLRRCKHCAREKEKGGWFWCRVQEQKNKSRVYHINTCSILQERVCPLVVGRVGD